MSKNQLKQVLNSGYIKYYLETFLDIDVTLFHDIKDLISHIECYQDDSERDDSERVIIELLYIIDGVSNENLSHVNGDYK